MTVARATRLVLRHLLAVLLLPFVMVVVVPAWLLDPAGGGARWSAEPLPEWAWHAAGGALFVCGFALFAWCVLLFARVGRGTLAPWDPTRELVAAGPYRHVRNPMIGGVALMLAGEALVTRAWPLAGWAALFVAVNHAYFVGVEEPGLERRFGEPYRAYRAAVPRWLPRPIPAAELPARAHFILYVDDQAASTAFYAAVLGRKPSLDVPGMTEFRLADGAVLGLMPAAGIRRLLGDALPDPSSAAGVPRAELYLYVPDPGERHARALAHGARELSPPQRRGWGDVAAYALDPDGHVVAFASRSRRR